MLKLIALQASIFALCTMKQVVSQDTCAELGEESHIIAFILYESIEWLGDRVVHVICLPSLLLRVYQFAQQSLGVVRSRDLGLTVYCRRGRCSLSVLWSTRSGWTIREKAVFSLLERISPQPNINESSMRSMKLQTVSHHCSTCHLLRRSRRMCLRNVIQGLCLGDGYSKIAEHQVIESHAKSLGSVKVQCGSYLSFSQTAGLTCHEHASSLTSGRKCSPTIAIIAWFDCTSS